MGLADVAAEHEMVMREVVYRETWGHLDANPGTRYNGTMTFALSAFADPGPVILTSDFGNAGYGPWFYEGVHEWLHGLDLDYGRIYRFRGFYRLRAHGRHEFVGEITEEVSLCS